MSSVSQEGYRITIHRSLTEPILLAGVPRSFAIMNATLAVAIVLGLHVLFMLPINIILHFIVVQLVKKDRDLFEVLSRYFKYKTYYRP
tara:strand:- start:171 stop:434 length:264 start_codon:yes stop_codon:yes gene_type:complete